MTNKKILNFIPNFSFGGVETTNINLSETLIKFGYEVELLTNDYHIVNKSEYLVSANPALQTIKTKKIYKDSFLILRIKKVPPI